MPDEKGRFKKGEKPSKKALEASKIANIGNQNALKLTTDELKKEAYRQYCEHLSKGNSQESFYFEHPDLTITYKTLNKYIKDEPTVFPPIKREVADIKSLQHWEQIIKDMVDDKRKEKTALVQMVMRNKFGWDKENKNQSSHLPDFLKFMDQLKKQE